MINLKDKKGITIVSLILTIIILLILTSVIISNISTDTGDKEYRNMIADIQVLEDKVLIYYNKYGVVPKTGNEISTLPSGIVVNSGDVFYKLDIAKLSNLTLSYGVDVITDENGENTNIYIINEKTLEIYYLKGVEYNGDTIYRRID